MKNFNLIVTYGSGGKGNNILPAGAGFQEKFITRDIVIFVFERTSTALGDNQYLTAYRQSNLYTYLVEIGVGEDTFNFESINAHVSILSCKIAGHNATFILINSYYISLYKPLLKPLVRAAHISIFFDSIHQHSAILNNDNFCSQNFTHYLFSPGAASRNTMLRLNRNLDKTETGKYKFLLDLRKARNNPQIIKDIAFRTFYHPLSYSAEKELVDALAEIEERLKTPIYSEAIKFIPQPGLYNLLGGRRKTRRAFAS